VNFIRHPWSCTDGARPNSNYDLWLGPAPWRAYNKNRVHYNFRFFWDYSGGQMTNWGAHHLDIAQWGLGMDNTGPLEIEATAKFDAAKRFEVPVESDITYRYADGVKLFCTQGPDRKTGTTFEGEKGWIHVNRGVSRPATRTSWRNPCPPMPPGSTSARITWTTGSSASRPASCRSATSRSGTAPPRSATWAASPCASDANCQWDPVKEEFPATPKANAMRHYAYRKPWELPKTA
jgi:hypothetical protein